MLRKLLPRSIYDVMAAIACFGVLAGGTAYAANTVFSSDIVDGEVKSIDIGQNEVGSADVKDNSLNTFDVHSFLGADVVDNTLTGADVDESSLNLAAEPWHEVGAPGEPVFHANTCVWQNFGAGHTSAAFLRDRFGFVHLKGALQATDLSASLVCGDGLGDEVMFSLPAGYRAVARSVFATLTNNTLGRINVDSDGTVAIENPGPADADWDNVKQYVSLDGISFRCAPSGSNGCP